MAKGQYKFICVAAYVEQSMFGGKFFRPGFYNWSRAMGGEVKVFESVKNKLDEFDIIMIIMAKPDVDAHIVQRVRDKIGWSSDKKVIVGVDLAVEIWQENINLMNLKESLKCADLVIASEPAQKSYFDALLDGEQAPPVIILDHPVDTNNWKATLGPPPVIKEEKIISLIHHYDNHWMGTYLATHDQAWPTMACFMHRRPMQIELTPYHPSYRTGISYDEFLPFLAKYTLAVDSYQVVHSMGRTAIDCALVGTLCVGADCSRAQSFLFPSLTSPAGDIMRLRDIVSRVIKDGDLRMTAIEIATNKVEYYSYENSVARLESLVEVSQPKELPDEVAV